eukprot:8119264-Prorocentrum_lima.AAC.1
MENMIQATRKKAPVGKPRSQMHAKAEGGVREVRLYGVGEQGRREGRKGEAIVVGCPRPWP